MEMCLSCSECGVTVCKGRDGEYPPFCPTRASQDTLVTEALETMKDPEVKKLTVAAAETETQGYCRWCRIEDTISFAKRIGAKRIGVATCIGLLKDAKLLAQVLKAHDFEVYTVSCKVGGVAKTAVGIPEACNVCGVNICNPILQAKYLNSQKTDLNIAFGLCVGHDSLFFRYSDAFCTTLVVKDRVTGHNPIVPLHMLDNYYKKLLQESELDLVQEIKG